MQIKNISRNRLGLCHRHWRLTLSLSWSKCKFCHCFNEIGLAYTRWNSNGLRSRTWMLSFTMIKPSKPCGYNLSFLTVKFENDSFEAMVIKLLPNSKNSNLSVETYDDYFLKIHISWAVLIIWRRFYAVHTVRPDTFYSHRFIKWKPIDIIRSWLRSKPSISMFLHSFYSTPWL